MRTRSARILAVVSVLALLSAPLFSQENRRLKELPNFHRVNGSLFRGGQPKPGGFELLSRLGIKTVLNLRDDDDREAQEELEAEQAGLRYFNVPLRRLGRPNDRDIEAILGVINNPENQPVFVHCAHGADRTGVVIAVYRIVNDGWTGDQARAEAKRYGLKPWQLRKKDYISDYYKKQVQKDNLTSGNVKSLQQRHH
jgi:tyrosine-protein phosphatase SIW14